MNLQRSSILLQSILSFGLVAITALICFFITDLIGYQAVALILLLMVSLLAMSLEIVPVLIAAVSSALIWNFFFIPPLLTFRIENAEDLLLFLMYFIIALLNAVLTSKIRDGNRKIRAKEEQEKAMALHTTVLNSLAHEFRTPIATMLASLDTLQQQQHLLSENQKSDLLEQMNESILRLDRLVGNALNQSRLESGLISVRLDWVDLNELIHRTIHKVKSASHPIQFMSNDSAPLYKLDSLLIEQVMSNLLQNAIQYTPENTLITIEHTFQDPTCTITVSDTGPGIASYDLKAVFDKFYRPTGTIASGLGLGLYIVKGFVEAHHGTITLSQHPTGGSTFVIVLPVETSFIQHLKHE
jgi:two-component system sensor histidine kinase KdpD